MALTLTNDIKDMVNNALANNTPLALAVVSRDNKPVLSFRGSTQVYSDSALCLWMRKGSGTTLDAVQNNPHVALIYRSATTPVIQFQGRARVADTDAERKAVFEKAPQAEQSRDPERTGTAIIIDLDSVTGMLRFGENGPEFVKLTR